MCLGFGGGVGDRLGRFLGLFWNTFVQLLENVGGEVEKCWVQVGDPAGDGINEVPMGNETTDRRAAGDPKVGTGQPEGDDEGVFKIKLGTVNENDPVIQKVSSDVVWTPTVMDRIKI